MTNDTVAKSAAFVWMKVMYELAGWTTPHFPPQRTLDFTKDPSFDTSSSMDLYILYNEHG